MSLSVGGVNVYLAKAIHTLIIHEAKQDEKGSVCLQVR